MAIAAQEAERRVLDFPKQAGDAIPQWRQEAIARLRDYQARRENRPHMAPAPRPRLEPRDMSLAPAEEVKPVPGVVSLNRRKELEPLVVRALQRIDRARENVIALQQSGRPPVKESKVADLFPLAELPPEPEEEIVVTPAIKPKTVFLSVVETKPRPTETWEKDLEPDGLRVDNEPAFAIAEDAPAPPVSKPRLFIDDLAPEPQIHRAFAEADEPPADEQYPTATSGSAFSPAAPLSEAKAAPRKVCAEVIDDAYLERLENARAGAIRVKRRQIALAQGLYDDFAPYWVRALSAAVDWGLAFAATLPLLFIAGLSESTWHWSQMLLLCVLSMGVFMAAYATAITFYTGRTWGQELLFLCVANVEKGEPPTLRQCFTRAVIYLLTPLTFGLGLLYALWDAEGRTLHDKLSGTIVLRS